MPYSTSGSGGGGGAASIVVGNPVTGGGTNRVLYEDGSSNLATSTSLAFDGTTFTVGVPGAANSVAINETAGQITFEGATADAFETRLGVTDPTVGDQTYLLPNRGAAISDTIATLGATQTFSAINTFSGATGAIRTANGAAATPSYSFTSNTNAGLSWNGTWLQLVTGGVVQAAITGGGVAFSSTNGIFWSSGADPSVSGSDIGVVRVVAGVLGLTNSSGTAGQKWLQQGAGELALNADYTNATAGFTSTNLSAAVISGRTYSFTCVLFFQDSTAADGAQFDFNGGSAGVTNFRAHASAVNATGTALVLTNANSTALATAIQVALALTTQTCITIQGTFVPSGSGTFIVRGAQTAHTAGTLTIDRGSWLNIRDANPL